MRVSQAEFDKQVEITKLLMDGLKAIQTNHLRHLKTFVEVQAKYYANCHQIMQDVQKELARYVREIANLRWCNELNFTYILNIF